MWEERDKDNESGQREANALWRRLHEVWATNATSGAWDFSMWVGLGGDGLCATL